ncbi:hypothetical protein PO909_027681, partial [Leuciscus waleckii]
FPSLYYRAASHQHVCHFITEPVLKSLSFHFCGLKPMKMFWTVLLCLCFWRLDESSGVFGVTVKSVSVKEGDSVSLNSDLTEMKDDDVIQWRIWNKNTLIAEINVTVDRITVYDDVLDGRFRDRLKLDNQTGSLTITDITMKLAGVYELQINSEIKSFFLTVNGVSVMEGDSVTLNSDLTEMKDDDVIQWSFKNNSIAE